MAGTAKMGAIAGKSTALRQVRLIQTAAAAQFADMAITVSGQPTATPAPFYTKSDSGSGIFNSSSC